ncbi:MAG: hypothetical protein ACP5II_00645 [Infirmifilum sp.]|jgi:hypothetical protein|uniref:hypothetical protein n=1 Tax=Infirmifilum TaxID=2856573 RepID=UPI002353EDD1
MTNPFNLEILSRLILELARRDIYNNVGRVFIKDLLDQGYTREEITAAITKLKSQYKIVVIGELIKVYFSRDSNVRV